MKLSELAFGAAEVMAVRGHCKYFLCDGEGRVCFNGALNVMLNGTPWNMMSNADWPCGPGWDLKLKDFRSVSVVADEILQERGFDGDPVRYNNSDVSGEDVISLLKETGHRLEEAGR